MQIGINLLTLDVEYEGGITSYVRGLLDGFRRIEANERFVICANAANAHRYRAYGELPNFDVRVFSFDVWWKRWLIWQAVKIRSKRLYSKLNWVLYLRLARELDRQLDVVYFPNTQLFPYHLRKPTVVSLHDIQHVHFPEFFSPAVLKDRNITYPLSAQQADYLQASSEHMREDFLTHFPFLQTRQVVKIQEGVDTDLFRTSSDGPDLVKKYSLPNQFLYYPAQLWPHKNHMTVLRALQEIRDKHRKVIPLVMTGAEYSATDELLSCIAQLTLRGQVHYLGKIPFDDVVGLYRNARFLITAVLYESTSLPILEAAASGTPIIASATRPNCELASRLKINLFEPTDVQDLVSVLLECWDSSPAIDEQIAHNYQHIDYYSWDKAAVAYLRLFREIVHTNSGI